MRRNWPCRRRAAEKSDELASSHCRPPRLRTGIVSDLRTVVEGAMSASGQNKTYAVHQLISALHPIASAKANFRTRSCLLYPRKRTCAVQLGMSALCHKRTFMGGRETSAKGHNRK